MDSQVAASAAEIDELLSWFQENQNLPKAIDTTLLRRFHQSVDGDMDKTKRLIEVNYALRNNYGGIFLERDPTDEDTRNTFEFAYMLALPGLTPEKYKISCYGLSDYDPKKMHYAEDVKTFFMFTDSRFSASDVEAEDTLANGEIQVFDLKGCTMKHMAKMKISIFRIYMKFLQQAYPVRLRAVHIINCPPYMDKIMAVIRPFIGKEVSNMIIFHTEGLASFYDAVPRDMLPEEYGGKAGKLRDLKERTLRIMIEKRDYLMDLDHWKIDGPPRRTLINSIIS